eukprot:gnl/TRDRNA2_/TRDRNA2_85436_c0_seq1.p1 gnl/TRDRNA2_/TRDRNA2_85436_c0~~gnl/TRDRNA2_/TRDRNA2_85436_c0_seq1.p1  ORF type:complete len:521 (-),score=110.73 gnl/TRDRNA2_/TRDRNA2_85436_c0_seq1:17-1507(-)
MLEVLTRWTSAWCYTDRGHLEDRNRTWGVHAEDDSQGLSFQALPAAVRLESAPDSCPSGGRLQAESLSVRPAVLSRDDGFDEELRMKLFVAAPDGQTLASLRVDSCISLRELKLRLQSICNVAAHEQVLYVEGSDIPLEGTGKTVAKIFATTDQAPSEATLVLHRVRRMLVLSCAQDGSLKPLYLHDGSGSEDEDDDVRLQAHGRALCARAVNGILREIFCCSTDGSQLELWDMSRGELRNELALDEEMPEQDMQQKQAFPEVTVAVVDWGSLHALGGLSNGSMKLWNIGDAVCVRKLEGHTGAVRCIAINWDRLRVLSGSEDGSLKLWELTGGGRIEGHGVCVATLTAHSGGVWALAVHWDSERALSGSADHTLMLWDIASSERLRIFRGHEGVVRAIVVDWPSGRALSCSEDASLRLWEIDAAAEETQDGAAKQIFTEVHGEELTSLVVDWACDRAATGSRSGSCRVWNLAGGVCLRTAAVRGEVIAVASDSQS